MPYISTVTTKKISEEKKKELTSKLGEAISLIPGKSEEWLMLKFEGAAAMAFRGDVSAEAAMVEVSLFGTAGSDALEALTAKITEILNSSLGIPKDGVYIKYFETDTWGFNGFNL